MNSCNFLYCYHFNIAPYLPGIAPQQVIVNGAKVQRKNETMKWQNCPMQTSGTFCRIKARNCKQESFFFDLSS
jgi:hypothetical protein